MSAVQGEALPPGPDTQAACDIDSIIAQVNDVLVTVRAVSPAATVYLLMARCELTTLAGERRGHLIRIDSRVR